MIKSKKTLITFSGNYLQRRTFIKITLLLIFSIMIQYSYAQDTPDSTKKYDSSLSAYPFVYYTPETELAFGAGGVFTFYSDRDPVLNPSNVTFSGFYSTVETYELSIISNLFFRKNTMASSIDLSYGNIVERFYGIGNDSPELGNEEYVMENVGGMVDFQIPSAIVISDRSGLIVEYRDYVMSDRRDNPYLQDDEVIGSEGGVVAGLGVVWVWDVRDHVFFPNFGGITTGRVIFYTGDMGSDYTFSWVEVDARRYWSVGEDKVIAAQLYYNGTGGSPPFYKLPALGGSSIMRGYFSGRYRDEHYFAMQAEYRQFVWWKFGMVAFIGMGDVTDEITRLQMRYLKPSYGFGLRFLFDKEQKINLRMDIGFGKDTSGIYFGIEEAF
jgi:hypothetical protein